MISETYADNLARSNFSLSRDIAGRGVTIQSTGQDLSNIDCHYDNNFGQYKTECADFKAIHLQNQRRRRRQHK